MAFYTRWQNSALVKPVGGTPMLMGYARKLQRARHLCCRTPRASSKVVWVETSEKGVFTAAVEQGLEHFVFRSTQDPNLAAWKKLAAFKPIIISDDMIVDETENQIGCVCHVESKEQQDAALRLGGTAQYVLMEADDWKIIPAENLIAVFHDGPTKLMAAATSAADARLMLEALEIGTAGVLMRSNEPKEVRQLVQYVQQRNESLKKKISYELATVVRVVPVGMGDRVCVDLASMMQPGEGMLVGSYSRSLFLVHSECEESGYINSRPFRVNAGPVHSYVQANEGKTAYLSELSCGAEVLIADAAGRQRAAIVGRAKIESRPLVLVEAATADGCTHCILLQNAETVKLVGPPLGTGHTLSELSHPTGQHSTTSTSRASSASSVASSTSRDCSSTVGGASSTSVRDAGMLVGAAKAFRTISVSNMVSGDQVFLHRQEGARHTGIKINERIVEK